MRDQGVHEHLDALLRVILDQLLSPASPGPQTTGVTSTDFIMWRGTMTVIICTPYNRKEGWELAVTRFKGKLFVDQRDLEADRAKRAEETEQQRLMTFFGFKFEQYATWGSRTPPTKEQIEARNSQPVNNFESFCSVASTKLGSHRILFGAEVDCAGSPCLLSAPKEFRPFHHHHHHHSRMLSRSHGQAGLWGLRGAENQPTSGGREGCEELQEV